LINQDRHGPRYRDCPSTPRIAVFISGRTRERHTKQSDFHPPPPKQPNNNPERGPQPRTSSPPFNRNLLLPSTRPQRRESPAQASRQPSLCSSSSTTSSCLGPRVSEISRYNAESTLLLNHIVQLDLQHQHPVLPAQRVPSALRTTYTTPHQHTE